MTDIWEVRIILYIRYKENESIHCSVCSTVGTKFTKLIPTDRIAIEEKATSMFFLVVHFDKLQKHDGFKSTCSIGEIRLGGIQG